MNSSQIPYRKASAGMALHVFYIAGPKVPLNFAKYRFCGLIYTTTYSGHPMNSPQDSISEGECRYASLHVFYKAGPKVPLNFAKYRFCGLI